MQNGCLVLDTCYMVARCCTHAKRLRGVARLLQSFCCCAHATQLPLCWVHAARLLNVRRMLHSCLVLCACYTVYAVVHMPQMPWRCAHTTQLPGVKHLLVLETQPVYAYEQRQLDVECGGMWWHVATPMVRSARPLPQLVRRNCLKDGN
jgi:ABC-type hemin transport system ATPase subunit